MKKLKQTFIELSKPQLWLWMHGIFIGAIMFYQGLWLFSERTMAVCYANVSGPELQRINSGTLLYTYYVNGKKYDDYSTRNETPLTQHLIEIRYLSFAPSFSRINSFEGNWLGFMIAYLIFFTVTTMIFFIPNDTMPRNSYFYLPRKRPFIHMIVK